MNYGRILAIKVQCCPRINDSSAKQSKGQNVWSDIKSYTPDDFVNKDKYQEGIGQMEAKKYLKESCYHRIKSSIANSLAALMWR